MSGRNQESRPDHSEQERRLMARRRFGETVERLRGEGGYSLEELSGRSMIETAEIESLVRGETEAQVDDIYLLAGALGVEPGDLFDGVRWIPPAAGGDGYEFAGVGQDG